METPPDPQKQRQHRIAGRKQKRAARACDVCRRQKEKCDGGVPCRRCTRIGHRCEFSGRTDSQGTGDAPAAAFDFGSEPVPQVIAIPRSHSASASASAERSPAPLPQRVAYLEKIVQRYVGDISFDSESLRSLAENIDRERSPARLPLATNDSSNSSNVVGVNKETFTIEPLDNNITHYSGEFSHWNFSMRIKQWIEQSIPKEASSSTNYKEYYRAEDLQSPSSITTSLSSLPPKFVASFLFHSFFKHAEANYWYVEKEWLADKCDAVYENAGSLSRRDVGAVCMIFMVLAIGTQHAYLESDAERLEDPSAHDQAGSGLFSEDTVGFMFYQQACRLLPDVITISSLESVQACMLIGIYTLPLDASGLSYIYLNLAVRLAVQNGMHRKYPGEGLDPSIRETRNRVWWTVYTIERYATCQPNSNSIEGESGHARTKRELGEWVYSTEDRYQADVDADLPVDRTDIWPSSTSVHVAHFLATLRLNQVLSKMSHEISILRTYSKNEISNGLGRLIELRRELISWWEALPGDIFPKELTSQSTSTRLGMHLQMEYYLIHIFVGRAFIFPRDFSRSSSSSASPSSNSHPRSILVNDCIKASMAVVDICRHLRASIGLARASYTEFSACRAALLVITTQCLQKKTDRFRRALRDGLSMLKDMSVGGESARTEVSLIEAFERAIARVDSVAAEGKADSSYSRFKKWEQLWKSDPAAMEVTGDRPHDNPMPMAPQPAGSWRADEGPPRRQGTVPMPSYTPFFSMDGNFASFPQTLDEFSSFLGYSFGPSPDSTDTAGDRSTWIGL